MERLKHDQFVKSSQCPISFNSQLTSLKSSLGLWEDMIAKTSKLSASLKTVIQCIGGFLEAFQKIADCAYSSNCGLRELGSSMTRLCLRERGLESRLRTFNSQLTECLTAPLVDRLEEWKRTVVQLDKENGKEWRRAKSELQRATCELEKLSKRSRRKGSSVSGGVDSDSHAEIYAFPTAQSGDSSHASVLQSGDNMHLNFAQHDLILKQRTLAELERVSLRRAVVEERRRFAELLTCLKPVLDSKLAIFGDVSMFEECILAITHNSYDPNQIPDDIEEAIDYAVGHVTSSLTCDRKYSTSFGSRSESRCTLRSTKQNSTAGSGLEVSNNSNNFSSGIGLSCHASELSLQSSISASTNSSWNTGNTNHSQSTIHASSQHCDAFNTGHNATNADGTSSHPHVGVGDSVSLFENPEGSISGESGSSTRPVQNSVLDSVNSDWIPLPGLINKDANSSEVKMHTGNSGNLEGDDDGRIGTHENTSGGTTTEDTEDGETDDEKLDHSSQDSNKSRQTPILYPNQAIPGPVYTNLNELKKAAARKFQNRNSPVVNSSSSNNNNNNYNSTTDGANDSVYGGRKFSMQLNEEIAMTQPITAGIDHNGESCLASDVNKFDFNLSQSSQGIESSGGGESQSKNSLPLCSNPITPVSGMNNNGNVHGLWEYDQNPGLIQSTYQNKSLLLQSTTVTQLPYPTSTSTSSNSGLCDVSQSTSCDTGGGYISTCVNSGTSTFRRRQSEYFKKSLDGTNSGTCSSPPPLSPSSKNSNYASVTPGLMRRSSQAYQQHPHVGRLCDRPIHPPRRSSSVSRELVSHNNNNVNSGGNLLTVNQHQHYSRLNLSDFAGNKNPHHFHQFMTSRIQQSNFYQTHPNSAHLTQEYQYRQQQVSSPSSSPYAFATSSTVNSSHCSRVGGSPGYSTLGGIEANHNSTSNNCTNGQLMFGVKVLPNVTPGLLNNSNNQSRLPQRNLIRQASCEPPGSMNTIGLSNTQMNPLLITDHQSHQFVQQQQQQSHYAANLHNSRKNSHLQQQGALLTCQSSSSSLKQQHQLIPDDGVTSFID
ncbi:unnamed protein product [Heterobilharzia americana]|nr:unnamed protein product [Heterobilharzia americana]